MSVSANRPTLYGVLPKEFMNPDVENWCLTNISVIKFNYLWTINNFSYCQEEIGETIKSPLFSSSDNEREKWCLRVSPRGFDEETKDYVSLYLLLVSCDKLEIRAKFRFSLINDRGEEVKAMESQKAYKFVYGKDWGFKKFIKRDFLFDESNSLLVNDNLKVFCEISIITDPVSVSGKNDKVHIEVPDCRLKDDFEQLFLNNDFSDVTISTNGQEFKAHKAILAARSPVFSAMFKHEMEEGRSNHVIISDIEDEVVEEMLRFIYSGKVNNLEKVAFDLLGAADKYGLEGLKIMCEQVLCKHLSFDNVVDNLVLADLHSSDRLKSQALVVLSAHIKDVMKTDSWKSIVESHPRLISEAFQFFASQELFISPLCKRIKYH